MVYVDAAKHKFGRMIMSHMIADTIPELHEMADKIGIKRKWFQNKSVPHYDICQSKKQLAIDNCAILACREKMVDLIKMWKNRKKNDRNA